MKQLCTLSILLVLSTLSIDSRAQVNVGGYWLGVTYPTDPNQAIFNYTMTLVQNANTVGGTAQSSDPTLPFGGIAFVNGVLTGTGFSFYESDRNGSTAVKGICFFKGSLVYNATDESLTGTYQNIVNSTTCTSVGGGTIELYRVTLKSPNAYCPGAPITLRVTGKNLRWYSSDTKKTLLASGNSYSPAITKTTTFYITQTLYKNESPPVPITIYINDPALDITTLNTGCDKANGSISVAANGSAGWQYSLNGGPFQKNTVFTSLKPGSYTVVARDSIGCSAEKSVAITNDSAPVITSLVSTPPLCATANGSVSVVATGGKSPLTYSINYGVTYQSNPLFTNLAGGAYTLRVRDANACEVNRAINLPPFKPMDILTSSAMPTTCGQPNGQVDLTTAGGTKPVQYSIDNKTYQASSVFAGLSPGSYILTARDSAGCTVSKSLSVAASSGPQVATAQATVEECGLKNGSVTIVSTLSGGREEYSLDGQVFQRSTAFTGLAAGTYQLTTRDGSGCTVSQTIAIPVNCRNVVHLPQAFSPNRDNANDQFSVRFAFSSLSVSRFTVYDRWGMVIYNRNNFTLTSGETLWDGQQNGEKASPGTYLYRLDCQFPDGTQSSYRESIALLN